MTVESLLARLESVRPQVRGWTARCPAHDDHTPSLSVREGDRGLLLKCWAGCTFEDVCEALGAKPKDLFYDAGLPSHERRRATQTPRPQPFDWRLHADQLEDEAWGLWLRGTAVLEAARGLDPSSWTDADIDTAMEAVACARTDSARAECFYRLAVNVRTCGMKKEKRP